MPLLLDPPLGFTVHPGGGAGSTGAPASARGPICAEMCADSRSCAEIEQMKTLAGVGVAPVGSAISAFRQFGSRIS